MMNKITTYFCLVSFGIVMGFSEMLTAQTNDDLYIFGFSQTLFNHKIVTSTAYPFPSQDNPTNGVPFELKRDYKSNSFALHQLNLFFRKQISEKSTFFLNLEATGSYSTEYESGNFQIPEGWLSYDHSEKLKLKLGLLLPKFNNLNEINNRLPLFPYLIRPLVYEVLFYGVFSSEDYLPERGYLQLTGELPIAENYIFEYAAYVGNSEASYSSNNQPGEGSVNEAEVATIYKGENLTTKLSYGTRIGISNFLETARLGLSGTYDHDNRNTPSASTLSRFPDFILPAFGDVPRFRVGTDLFMSFKKISLEGEFIGVFHDHSGIRSTLQYRNVNLNKFFYYGLATYNFSEQVYAFAGHNRFWDSSFEFLLPNSVDKAGIFVNTFGAGWKPFDGIVAKFQVSNYIVGDNPHIESSNYFITTGVSVIF